MSLVSYNGINLPYAQATSFKQEAVYDPVGGVDRILTKFDIQVQCYLNAAYFESMAPALFDNTVSHQAADIMSAVRTRLLKPKKTLSYKFNGVDAIPKKVNGNAGTVDAKNGPQPQSCVIQRLTNETFLLIYHITAHYWEKGDTSAGVPLVKDNNSNSPILYHRWTEMVTQDRCLMSIRTRTGKYGIRSDNREGATADTDAVRDLFVLGVPEGFQRKSSKYKVSPDGLAMEYEVVDEEVFRYPPAPALDWEGHYTEIQSNFAAIRLAEVVVRLKSAKSVPQNKLVEMAMAIVGTKLQIVGAPLIGPDKKRGIPLSVSVRSHMKDNVVEVKALVRFRSDKRRLAGIVGLTENIAEVPFTGNQLANKPPWLVRGTAGIVLQAAAYYDPNLVTIINNQGQSSQGLEIGTAGKFAGDP